MTTCSVCSAGIWKTPKPRIGISTPLLSVTVGTFVVIRELCPNTSHAMKFVTNPRFRGFPDKRPTTRAAT